MKFRLLSIPTVIDTYWRFPLPLICSAAVFLLILDERYGLWGHLMPYAHLDRVTAILFAGIFFHSAIALVPAATGRAAMLRTGAGIAVHLAFGFSVIHLPDKALFWPVLSACAVGLLLVAVTPFLRGRDNSSFWQFNRIVWQGLAIAGVAGVLLAGGVSVGLLGIEQLFSVDFKSRVYGDIWSFVFLIVVPLHALSFVPTVTHFPEQDCQAPRPLSVIIDWIMAPLALAYMLILYAYFIKIGIAGELPKGILAYLVTAFGGFGIVTYLVGWPMRDGGGPLLRLFYKVFIPAMAIPVALQAVSIYQRVEAYGLTENRVVIIVATLWFALVLAARLVRQLPLKVIPALLALLLAVVTAGPLSAYRLSVWDQSNRLDAILDRHGMLQDGRIVPAASELPAEDRVAISSILSFLTERRATEDIQQRVGIIQDYPGAEQITRAMGFAYLSEWELKYPSKREGLQLGAKPDTVPTAGFDTLLQEKTYRPFLKGRAQDKPAWPSLPKINAVVEDGVLTYTVADKGSVALQVLSLLTAEAAKKKEDRSAVLVIEGENDYFRVRTYFWADVGRDKVEGQAAGTDFQLDTLHYLTLYAEKGE